MNSSRGANNKEEYYSKSLYSLSFSNHARGIITLLLESITVDNFVVDNFVVDNFVVAV